MGWWAVVGLWAVAGWWAAAGWLPVAGIVSWWSGATPCVSAAERARSTGGDGEGEGGGEGGGGGGGGGGGDGGGGGGVDAGAGGNRSGCSAMSRFQSPRYFISGTRSSGLASHELHDLPHDECMNVGFFVHSPAAVAEAVSTVQRRRASSHWCERQPSLGTLGHVRNGCDVAGAPDLAQVGQSPWKASVQPFMTSRALSMPRCICSTCAARGGREVRIESCELRSER